MRRVAAALLTLAAVIGFGHDTRAEPRPPSDAGAARKAPRKSKAVADLANVCTQRKRTEKRPPPPQGANGFKVVADGGTPAERSQIAGAIAAAVRRPLERVQLRTIIGKDVAETQKNLDALLERAERQDFVLYLDEADALFGKRTEVKDSHDRYANVETSFVLQRLRAHEGIVVFGAKLSKDERAGAARQVHRVLEATARGQAMWTALC